MMDSRVSSHDTDNIHMPSIPSKNKSTERETRGEQLLKKATDLKVYTCSDTDLGEVPFHDVIFWE